MFDFRLQHTDAHTSARRGIFSTPHGDVQTPAFMPVGTQASVKGLEIEQLRATGSRMILGNTYHLTLRPGEEVVAALGGLHKFMGWDGPILTDSGGFQLFSLAQCSKVTEEHAVFRSHIDGHQMTLSPERAVAIQEKLGSDVAMVLDHVVGLPNHRDVILDAMERSIRWARRCQQAATRSDQAQFAIVQGGLEPDLRVACARQLRELDFPGYAVGGLSVGEEPSEMYRMLDITGPRIFWKESDAASTCSTVSCRRAMVEMLWRLPTREACGCAMPSTNVMTDRWRPTVPVPRAVAAADTFAICLWPAKCSARRY